MKITQLFISLAAIICIVSCQLTLLCEDVLRIPAEKKYEYSLNANGGKQPYSYTASGLPDGISIVGKSLVGQSNVVGVFPVVLTVNDADKSAANKHIFIYITSPTGASSKSSQQVSTTITTASSEFSSNGQNSFGIPSSGIQSSQNRLFQSQSITPSNIGSQQGFQTGPITINVQNPNANTQVFQIASNPSNNLNAPQVGPTFVTNNPLIVPTTTPYITNYSFASSLQTNPTISSTQPAEAAFQRQSNINKAISSLLNMIQGFNATLLAIQQNIPNTTSLLNDAIKNQRVAQAQVNSIIAQNNSITNNISGIESGIKTLQNQMLTTTNTLNNSNAQVQSLQTKITQNYIQINQTKNKIQQANSSLLDAQQKRNRAAGAINQSREVILRCTQNITSLQTDINNSPVMLVKLRDQINNQKTIILALQKQLEAAILALVPIQAQVDYYTMIPTVGPGLIQQNKTILLVQSDNLARAQPIYDLSKNDIDTYNNLIKQLSTAMNSLQNQLSADQLAYDNIIGSQNNQQGLFNNTLVTIAAQTQLLNRMKQQQSNLLTGPYTAAQQVVFDSTSKVNQLTETLNSLNRKHQQVQSSIVTTQKTLNEAIQQKQLIDQEVNQVIQGGGSSSSFNSLSNSGSNIKIQIKGN